MSDIPERYILLKTGEILQANDEYLSDNNQPWKLVPPVLLGSKVQEGSTKYRRPNTLISNNPEKKRRWFSLK